MSRDINLNDRIYAYKVFIEDDYKVHVQIFQGLLKVISYHGNGRYVYTMETNAGELITFTEKSHMYKSKKNLMRALYEDLNKRTRELHLKIVLLQEAFYKATDEARGLL